MRQEKPVTRRHRFQAIGSRQKSRWLFGLALLVLILALWARPGYRIEARYQIQDQLGFVITLPSAP